MHGTMRRCIRGISGLTRARTFFLSASVTMEYVEQEEQMDTQQPANSDEAGSLNTHRWYSLTFRELMRT
ncbi:hypothetical protein V6N11_028406 [Hibiscus sabdariffa]|uniref:Uncharacterized protein n=1 Tax=Hibiscus sabdariffa TaxID=183260 RepID=A0ABR2NQF5_9ROSI